MVKVTSFIVVKLVLSGGFFGVMRLFCIIFLFFDLFWELGMRYLLIEKSFNVLDVVGNVDVDIS